MTAKTRPVAPVADPSPQAIAHRIREALAVLGASERELARRAGFAAENHVNTMLRRLDAGRAIEVDTLVSLSGALGRSLDWLATGVEVEARPAPGVRLRDVPGWPEAEADARRRGCREGAVRAVGESRWPTAPPAARFAPLVVALARAWSDAAD